MSQYTFTAAVLAVQQSTNHMHPYYSAVYLTAGNGRLTEHLCCDAII